MVSIDKNKVYIFDDIVVPSIQDNLVNKIGTIEWRLARNNRPHKYKIKVKDSDIWNQNRPGLIQSFQFDDNRWLPTSHRWFVEPPLSALEKKLGKKFELQRIKINLNPKDVPENKGSCFHPHSDLETNEWTAIYYVNESDGDTLIFNERGMDYIIEEKEISIKKRVKNKKGRIVMFNQSLLHCGMTPFESDYSVVINYNFRIK